MGEIHLRCTNHSCNTALAFSDSLMGTIQKCPNCGQKIFVPEDDDKSIWGNKYVQNKNLKQICNFGKYVSLLLMTLAGYDILKSIFDYVNNTIHWPSDTFLVLTTLLHISMLFLFLGLHQIKYPNARYRPIVIIIIAEILFFFLRWKAIHSDNILAMFGYLLMIIVVSLDVAFIYFRSGRALKKYKEYNSLGKYFQNIMSIAALAYLYQLLYNKELVGILVAVFTSYQYYLFYKLFLQEQSTSNFQIRVENKR